MYLNLVQLAESFGVSERTVEGWIRAEGLPCVTDRDRLLFDRAEVVAWAAARGLAAKAGFLAPETGARALESGLALDRLLQTGGVWRGIRPDGVLACLEQILARLPGAAPAVREMLVRRVRGPEGVTWAPVGGGVAFPHLRAPVALGRESGLLALVRLAGPLELRENTPDDEPVRDLFFFLAPSPRGHLELLARLSAAVGRGTIRSLLKTDADDAAFLAALSSVPAGGSRP